MCTSFNASFKLYEIRVANFSAFYFDIDNKCVSFAALFYGKFLLLERIYMKL